jgi:hypothetical protein
VCTFIPFKELRKKVSLCWKFYSKHVQHLAGMQLPEKYKDNFDPSLETSKLFLYFSGSCIPANESVFILLALYLHWHSVTDSSIIKGY